MPISLEEFVLLGNSCFPRPASLRKGKTLAERFATRIKIIESGCWEWQGGINRNGYGIFDGNVGFNNPHRFACVVVNGAIPDNLVCDHLCRNRKCANPNHLEIVTRSENTKRGLIPIMNREAARAQTHCKRGHALSEDNLYRYNGSRHCRACALMRAAQSKSARRLKAAAVDL